MTLGTRFFISLFLAMLIFFMKVVWRNFKPQGMWFDRWSIAHALFGLGLGIFFLDIALSMVCIFAWEFFEIWHDPKAWEAFGRNNLLDTVLGFVFAGMGMVLFK